MDQNILDFKSILNETNRINPGKTSLAFNYFG